MTFKYPVYYHLTRDQSDVNAEADLQKIIAYLLTFTGDINVKMDGALAHITYAESPLIATIKTSGDANRQITLTCEKEDHISVDLIKNITKNMNYRIFNAQSLSYMVNDPHVLDLTVATVEEATLNILKRYNLTPLFQYRESLVFYAQDTQGKIHLVNRHLLEFLLKHPYAKLFPKLFSIPVAPDLGRFVAMMDRGLIPLSFYKYINEPKNIINLSGFNIDKLSQNILIEQINFVLDPSKQRFVQTSSTERVIQKGQSLIKQLVLKQFLAIKIAQDVRFSQEKDTLMPNINVSVYLDA